MCGQHPGDISNLAIFETAVLGKGEAVFKKKKRQKNSCNQY